MSRIHFSQKTPATSNHFFNPGTVDKSTCPCFLSHRKNQEKRSQQTVSETMAASLVQLPESAKWAPKLKSRLVYQPPPRGRSPSRDECFTARSTRPLRSSSEPHMAPTHRTCDSVAVTPRRSVYEVKHSGETNQTPGICLGPPLAYPSPSSSGTCFTHGHRIPTVPTVPAVPTVPVPRCKSSGMHRTTAPNSGQSYSSKFVQWLSQGPVARLNRSASNAKAARKDGYAQKYQKRQNSTPVLRQVLAPQIAMPKPIRPNTGLAERLVKAETLRAENAALREELARANQVPWMMVLDVMNFDSPHCSFC